MDLVVDYGRPLLRGRTGIFGSGADYGKRVNPDAAIWRMGANDSTRLTTQAALQIGGTTIQPGVYNAFADLKPGAWTLVLNTQKRQEKYDPNEKVLLYGTYNYDAKFDVLRAPMTVRTTDTAVEQLTIGFVNVDRLQRHDDGVVGQDGGHRGHPAGHARNEIGDRRLSAGRPGSPWRPARRRPSRAAGCRSTACRSAPRCSRA